MLGRENITAVCSQISNIHNALSERVLIARCITWHNYTIGAIKDVIKSVTGKEYGQYRNGQVSCISQGLQKKLICRSCKSKEAVVSRLNIKPVFKETKGIKSVKQFDERGVDELITDLQINYN